jgi:hypothetical protein
MAAARPATTIPQKNTAADLASRQLSTSHIHTAPK